jgi:hypothetical protein
MTRELFDMAIADFDARMDHALQAGDFETLESLYEECVQALDGEEPTDEEVML